MNYHNNSFPPRQPVYNQWQCQSWNPGFNPNNNFPPRQPFPIPPAPLPNQAACGGPRHRSEFQRPQFQNSRQAPPQYFQRGNGGGYGNFQGGPRMTPPNQHGRSFQGGSNNGQNSYNNNRNGNRKSKKKKVDKRDLPENNNFFCDTCDRGFKTQEKYEEHVNGHQECSVTGCPYVAAPKLVQLHYQVQHKGGLAKKVWSLESKEDIDKWIEERKKNFPTPENRKRKETEQQQKNERGEVLETQQFGKFRRGKFGNNNQHFEEGSEKRYPKGRRGRFKRQFDQLAMSFKDNETDKTQLPNSEHCTDRDGFSETPPKKRLIDGDREQNSTCGEDPLLQVLKNETEEKMRDDLENDTPVDSSTLIGGLAAIVDLYNSDGEAETNKGETTVDVKSNDIEAANLKEIGEKTSDSKPRQRLDHSNKQQRVWLPRKRVTLLERLLASEIRHERNVVLQCVYYIVKNNFFTKTTSEGSKLDLTTELEEASDSNSKNCRNRLPPMEITEELQRADNSCSDESSIG